MKALYSCYLPLVFKLIFKCSFGAQRQRLTTEVGTSADHSGTVHAPPWSRAGLRAHLTPLPACCSEASLCNAATSRTGLGPPCQGTGGRALANGDVRSERRCVRTLQRECSEPALGSTRYRVRADVVWNIRFWHLEFKPSSEGRATRRVFCVMKEPWTDRSGRLGWSQ